MSASAQKTAANASLQTKTVPVKLNNGLSDSYSKEMAKALTAILAGTYRLTIKSHIYHWNVSGPLFKPIHDLTEEHYNALFAAADVIAERIRALGHLAPVKVGDVADFAPRNGSAEYDTAEAMVEDLIEDHETATRTMRNAVGIAEAGDDVVTADMLTGFMAFHEKASWMLRATVSG